MHILKAALIFGLINLYQCQEIIFPDTSNKRKHCVTASGERGHCRSRSSCPAAIANPGMSTTICSNRFIVCCPLTSRLITGAVPPVPISRGVSAPIPSLECGRDSAETDLPTFRGKRPSVLGGEESLEHAWPWMALLGRKQRGNIDWFCDGILINDQWVLTAAHCVLEITPFIVRLGEHDYDYVFYIDWTEDYDVETTIFYPDYALNKAYHDLALLKLSKKVLMTESIAPVCLPWGLATNKDYIGEHVTLTGWGAEIYGGLHSSILQEVDIEVFNPEVCQSSYSSLPYFADLWPSGMDVKRVICAGDLEGRKDACQGDSGGPLVHNNRGKYTLIGIVSKGNGCGKAKFPGLYVPVAQENYLAWIKKIAF